MIGEKRQKLRVNIPFPYNNRGATNWNAFPDYFIQADTTKTFKKKHNIIPAIIFPYFQTDIWQLGGIILKFTRQANISRYFI
jgi:hypothetical protein